MVSANNEFVTNTRLSSVSKLIGNDYIIAHLFKDVPDVGELCGVPLQQMVFAMKKAQDSASLTAQGELEIIRLVDEIFGGKDKSSGMRAMRIISTPQRRFALLALYLRSRGYDRLPVTELDVLLMFLNIGTSPLALNRCLSLYSGGMLRASGADSGDFFGAIANWRKSWYDGMTIGSQCLVWTEDLKTCFDENGLLLSMQTRSLSDLVAIVNTVLQYATTDGRVEATKSPGILQIAETEIRVNVSCLMLCIATVSIMRIIAQEAKGNIGGINTSDVHMMLKADEKVMHRYSEMAAPSLFVAWCIVNAKRFQFADLSLMRYGTEDVNWEIMYGFVQHAAHDAYAAIETLTSCLG